MRDWTKGMPKTVRIGCYIYSIELMHQEDAEIAGVMGATKLITQKIRMRPNQPPQQAANTFVHEVIHGIHDVYGLCDDSNEEEFTALTANGLCAFWQDNPKAVKWWESLLKMGMKNER